MSSYTSIHAELRQIDEMIVQAHAHNLITAIHHDLVRRKAILFAKAAAHLDADSMRLWEKDAIFLSNVMQQIDLFNVGEIDETTLYKTISNIKKSTEKAASDAAAAAASAATISAAAAISAAVGASAAKNNAEAGSLATKLARISMSPSIQSPPSSLNSLLLKKITTSQDLQPLLPISPISDWSEHKVALLKQRPKHTRFTSHIQVSTPTASDECDDDNAEAVPSLPQPAAKVVKAQRRLQNEPKSTQAETTNEAELSEERPQKRKLRSALGLQKGKPEQNTQNTIAKEDDDEERPAPKHKKRKVVGKQSHDKEEWHPTTRQFMKEESEESSESEVDELDSTSGEEKEPTSIRVSRRDILIQGTEQFYAKPCGPCSLRKTPCEKAKTGGSCVGCKVWKMKCMYSGTPGRHCKINTPTQLIDKTAQQKCDTRDSGRGEGTDKEQEPAGTTIPPTASTSQLGASSAGSMAVETIDSASNEARLQRIEAGYANIARMLLALAQQKSALE